MRWWLLNHTNPYANGEFSLLVSFCLFISFRNIASYFIYNDWVALLQYQLAAKHSRNSCISRQLEYHKRRVIYQGQSQASSNAMPNSFLASQHYNGDLVSPLSVMPFNSDGSLCFMESLSTLQPQGLFLFSSVKASIWWSFLKKTFRFYLFMCRNVAKYLTKAWGLSW